MDATTTKIYVRTYQYLVKIPGLSHLFGAMMGRANTFIIGQDRRVVATQPPTHDDLGRSEKLVPADLPIAQFRKELKRRATPQGGLIPVERLAGPRKKKARIQAAPEPESPATAAREAFELARGA